MNWERSLDEENKLQNKVIVISKAVEILNAASVIVGEYFEEINTLLQTSMNDATEKKRKIRELKEEVEDLKKDKKKAEIDLDNAENHERRASEELEEAEKELEDAEENNSSHQEYVKGFGVAGLVGGAGGVVCGVGALLFPPLFVPLAVGMAVGVAGEVVGATGAIVNKLQIKSADEMNRLRNNVTEAENAVEEKREKVAEAEEEIRDCGDQISEHERELEETETIIFLLKKQLQKLEVYKTHVFEIINGLNQVEPEVDSLRRNLEYYRQLESIGKQQARRMALDSLSTLRSTWTTVCESIVFRRLHFIGEQFLIINEDVVMQTIQGENDQLAICFS